MVSHFPQEVLSALPALIVNIAGLTSYPVAITIAERFGGLRLYFAARPTANNVLARAIGLDAARVLATQYGGESFDIPLCHALRNHKIRERLAMKISVATVAQEFKLTMRAVRRIRNIDTRRSAPPRNAVKSHNSKTRSNP